MTASAFCEQCGDSLSSDEKFCSSCGAKQTSGVESRSASETETVLSEIPTTARTDEGEATAGAGAGAGAADSNTTNSGWSSPSQGTTAFASSTATQFDW